MSKKLFRLSTGGNWYWLPEGKGYTKDINLAGIFFQEEAEKQNMAQGRSATLVPYEDIIYFILPVHHKRGCYFTVQVRRFDVDGCPIFVLCNNVDLVGSTTWVEYTYIDIKDCYKYENEQQPCQFSSEPEAVAAAVKFIRELLNQ